MSASAAAKQRLDQLHEQHNTYKEKLERQKRGLQHLQMHISQTKTVVDITIPGEIDKAYRQYIDTLEHCSPQYRIEKELYLRARAKGKPFRFSIALIGAANTVLTGLGAAIVWLRVLVVIVGLFFAGLFSSTPLQWRAAH